MPPKMIHTKNRDIPKQTQGFGQGETDCETTGKSRSERYSNTGNALPQPVFLFGLLEQGEKMTQMLTHGNIGHHPSIHNMLGDLTVNPFADKTFLGRKQGESRLVARTLDAENHGVSSASSMISAAISLSTIALPRRMATPATY